MRQIFINLISIYQLVVSPVIKQLLGVKNMCKFSPTCSEYAKESIKKNGIRVGIRAAINRLMLCQSFTKSYEYN